MTRSAPPPVDAALARDREAVLELAAEVLARHLWPDGLRVSPLGAAWSHDVDAHVRTLPADAELEARGWLPLADLLGRVGLDGGGCWAVVGQGRVLGKVDLHASRPPDPVQHVLARCRRDGVGGRELAEVAALRAAGHDVPSSPPVRPTYRVVRHRVGRAVGPLRTAARPRVVVAISGVDGAGKSTLTALLQAHLDRVGVPHGEVWVRPGHVSPLLDRVVRSARSARRQGATVQRSGFGEAARGNAKWLRSRQGLLGRAWTGVITEEFARAVWWQYLGARGVVVFDRHRRDAEVTTRLFYAARGSSRAVRAVRGALPPAALDLHLDVPSADAVDRKPGDLVGEWAVRAQVQMYDELLQQPEPGTVRLDATRPANELALEVFAMLTRLAGPR